MYVVLDDWQIWAPEFRPWIEQRFSPVVLEAFTAEAEPSWLEWLDAEQAAVDGYPQDSVTVFEGEMRAKFEGIRVIHASRLTSIEPIRQEGLRAWSAEDLRRQAQQLPSDRAGIERLRDVVRDCDPDHRGGYVYSFASLHHALRLDDRNDGRLPCFCIHGGEFLAAVRMGLDEHGIAPPEEGRAYLFACDLPWSILAGEDTRYLARTMLLNVLTSEFLEGNFSMHGENECMTTSHDVRPEFIKEFADVEHLKHREDLSSTDIPWLGFSAIS